MIGSSIVRVVIKSVNNGNIFIHNCNCKDNEMFVSSILHVTNMIRITSNLASRLV